ncbi:MAG TPA: AsmA-like C-terminal region-containing protein [Terracidiphilus sp.]|nr:AsmA-like C-terminal region-containing protein [Terracidiphilus sp.]
MAHASVPRPNKKTPPEEHAQQSRRSSRSSLLSFRRARPWLIAASFVVLAGVMAGIWFAGEHWPYRYREVKPLIEDVFGSQVTITRYHRTYFPHPGFIATGITVRRKSAPDQPPIGTVQTLFVQGRWPDLFLLRKRIALVDMTGVHMVLPPPGTRAAHEDFPAGSAGDFTGPDTQILEIEVHDSVLDILRVHDGRFTFKVRQLHIENVHKGEAMRFAVDMDNAFPSGQIRASGVFGPLSARSPGETLLSGEFTFNRVDLHDLGQIAGTLSSSGRFTGRLDAIEAEADTQTPDFDVDRGRPSPVAGKLHCTVNGLNGDVTFRSMQLQTGKTAIDAAGSVAGPHGKETNIDLSVKRGRAEDLLRPFMLRPIPIAGPVDLHAHVVLTPEDPKIGFWDRLHVNGAFDVPAERMTDSSSEKSLTAFSQRAQGGKAEHDETESADAISSLAGPVTIRNEVLTTHGLVFEVAGARAQLDGTFNFHTEAVHLTGSVATKASIAHDATGFKSFLLRPLSPFFRKKPAGAVIPIAVTGTPGNYKVTQNITHKK